MDTSDGAVAVSQTDVEADVDAERSRRRRKRILIGVGVAVAVLVVVAIAYWISRPDREVAANCVDDRGTIVDDANCVTPQSSIGRHYYGGGYYPVYIGSGGRPYHYNYGGSGRIGQLVSGGTTTVPRNSTRVVSSSGRTLSGDSASGDDRVSGGPSRSARSSSPHSSSSRSGSRSSSRSSGSRSRH